MISVSILNAIIYAFILVIFVLLFFIWFIKNFEAQLKLKNENIVREQIESKCKELNEELDSQDAATILHKLVDVEIGSMRDKINTYLRTPDKVKHAYIYEIRCVYLRLEKTWLLENNKDDAYWETVFEELHELQRGNILLFTADMNRHGNNTESKHNSNKD